MIKLNYKEVQYGKFPNNESYLPIEVIGTQHLNVVEWIYENDDEFFKLALLKHELDRAYGSKNDLTIRYFPHSRMDRVNGHYCMSLKVAAELVNNLKFDSISIIEPHSEVAQPLIDKCRAIEWCQSKIKHVLDDCKADTLFLPDAGAAKRYTSHIPYAVGHKHRDFESGDIVSYDLIGDVEDVVLIVDDLCSRGGTFINAAKRLREEGARKVFLLVAHLESNVFTGELFSHIDGLYTSKANILSGTNQKIILI